MGRAEWGAFQPWRLAGPLALGETEALRYGCLGAIWLWLGEGHPNGWVMDALRWTNRAYSLQAASISWRIAQCPRL